MGDSGLSSIDKEDVTDDFSQLWDNYLLFEKFFRHRGERLSDFLSQWKTKMANVQSAGFQYSDVLLACKLLDTSNLDTEDVHSIVNSIENCGSEILSDILTRLESFSPEQSERGEGHADFKEETYQYYEVKKESAHNGRQELSKCPSCNTEMDLKSHNGSPGESKRRTLVCESCSYEVHISTVFAPESSFNLVQEDDLSFMDTEVKDESLDYPQALLDVDINDLLGKEVKGRKMQKRKRKLRPPYEETKIHDCNICGKKYDRIRLVIAHMAKVHEVESSELAEYEEKLKSKPRIRRTKKELQALGYITDSDGDQECVRDDNEDKPEILKTFTEYKVHDFDSVQDDVNDVMLSNDAEQNIKLVIAEDAKEGKRTKQIPTDGTSWACQCEFCGKKFSRTRIQKHYEICSSRIQTDGIIPEKEPLKRTSKRKKVERFQCEFCGKEYPILSRLKEHYARCPNLDQEQREAKGYMREYNQVTCNICGKVLHREHNLKLHMTLHGEKTFKCDLCPATFNNSLYLFYHRKRHEVTKRHECSVCPKSFSLAIGLKRHIMREHTNERPFQCPTCSYKTVDKSHLNRHIRSHTGERPFKCNLCDKLYRDKKSVKRHMKAHHGQSDFSGLICDDLSVVTDVEMKLKDEGQK